MLARVVSYTFDLEVGKNKEGSQSVLRKGGTGLNSDGDADTLLTPDDGASYCTVLFCFPYYLLLLLPKKELITMKKKKEDCHNFIYFVLRVVPCCYCTYMLTPIDLIITLTPFETRTVSIGLWSYSARQTEVGTMKSCLFLTAIALLLTLSVATTSDFRESRKQRVQAILSKHGATNCYRSWIGDKTCDQACNNKNYGFDGGDCLPRFQQMHSTLRTEAFQSSFDVQVKGYTTTETTRGTPRL